MGCSCGSTNNQPQDCCSGKEKGSKNFGLLLCCFLVFFALGYLIIKIFQ